MTMNMNDTPWSFAVHNLPNCQGDPQPVLGPMSVHSPWHSASTFLRSHFLVVILARILCSSYPGVNAEAK